MRRSGFKPPARVDAEGKPRFSTFSAPRQRLAGRSEKMRAKYDGDDEDIEGRRAFRERILRERPACEGGVLIRLEGGGKWPWRCDYYAVDVHEILARSAGGDILDESNVKALCRACHDWCGNHPNEATSLGLRRSRYNRPRGKE